MPEGDTVFLAGKRLNDALAGKELTRGELRHPRWIEHDLTGRTVLEVATVGKHLFTRFDDATSLHSHFRMDGTWHLYRPGRPWRGADHQIRAILGVADRVAVGFRLHDLDLLPTDREDTWVGHLGPDLLAEDWGPDHAAEIERRLRADPDREIGAALLDQRVACGVGNLYKAEICFLVGISPWTPSATSTTAGSATSSPGRASCCCATPGAPSSRPPATSARAPSTGCSSAPGGLPPVPRRRADRGARTTAPVGRARGPHRLLLPHLPARTPPRPAGPAWASPAAADRTPLAVRLPGTRRPRRRRSEPLRRGAVVARRRKGPLSGNGVVF